MWALLGLGRPLTDLVKAVLKVFQCLRMVILKVFKRPPRAFDRPFKDFEGLEQNFKRPFKDLQGFGHALKAV